MECADIRDSGSEFQTVGPGGRRRTRRAAAFKTLLWCDCTCSASTELQSYDFICRLYRPSERYGLDRLDIWDLFTYNHIVHEIEVGLDERTTFTVFT